MSRKLKKNVCRENFRIFLFYVSMSNLQSETLLGVIQLTLLKSIFVRIVLWCNCCSGRALLPSGALGVCSDPCISLLKAYNWKHQRNTIIIWQTKNIYFNLRQSINYFLFCYVDWFIQNDPHSTLPTSRKSSWPFVSHVLVGIR